MGQRSNVANFIAQLSRSASIAPQFGSVHKSESLAGRESVIKAERRPLVYTRTSLDGRHGENTQMLHANVACNVYRPQHLVRCELLLSPLALGPVAIVVTTVARRLSLELKCVCVLSY